MKPRNRYTLSIVGDVCDKNSLADFFADADSRTCVIHCAGIVSVASRPSPKLYQVNVGGTWRILRQCLAHEVGRLIHVSSVHAIPEKPEGCVITESCGFSPGLVDGDYAKSKAAATELVFDAAERGLNASIVFPVRQERVAAGGVLCYILRCVCGHSLKKARALSLERNHQASAADGLRVYGNRYSLCLPNAGKI